jgi:hypothetical protein
LRSGNQKPCGLAKLVLNLGPSAWDVFERGLQNKAGYRAEIAGKGVATQAKRLHRNCPTTCKGVYDQWDVLAMRGFDQVASNLQADALGSVVPIGQVADEVE